MPAWLRPTLSVLTLAALAGCGGGDTTTPAAAPAPAAPVATGLAGKVAVGVVVANAKVRIVDAEGTEVARDIAVGSDGSYSVPTVGGRAPYRVEACGYAGADYVCITSVAPTLGTANVTPLTHATVLLATGRSPADVMGGSGNGLTSEAVSAAQAQLRTGLAGVMEGQVPSNFDFVSGELAAGSRTGYDRVLDAIGVATGVDGSAFVQITPRVGSGNLYLQAGSSAGSVTVDRAASALSLDGLDALFTQMSAAAASATACSASGAGMAAAMASDALLAMGGQTASGPQQVGSALCGVFEEEGLWGSRFASPTLGRCDATGAAPRCGISFVIETTDGSRLAVSNGMGVVRQGGVWKFAGSVFPLQMEASSRAQRTRRIDGDSAVDRYERAIAVEIQAVSGLACARVSQRDSTGARVTVAYFKPFGAGVPRLSAWLGNNGERSLDPAVGMLRSGDDSWLMLPEGTEGDAVVRNFFRGGRTLNVALYGDAACSTPMTVGGRSEFEIDIDGVPPVFAAMPGLPWPELTAATGTALAGLNLGAGASGELAVAWTYPRGRAGFNSVMFCADLRACGQDEPGRIGERSVPPSANGTTLTLRNMGAAMNGARMLSMYGGGPDRLGLQANFVSCSGVAAGQSCP